MRLAVLGLPSPSFGMELELAFVSNILGTARVGSFLGKDAKDALLLNSRRWVPHAKRFRLGRRTALSLESKGKKHHDNTGAFTSGSARRELSGLAATSDGGSSGSSFVSEEEVEVLEGFEDLLLTSNKKKVTPKTKPAPTSDAKAQASVNGFEVLEGFEDLFTEPKKGKKGKKSKAQASTVTSAMRAAAPNEGSVKASHSENAEHGIAAPADPQRNGKLTATTGETVHSLERETQRPAAATEESKQASRTVATGDSPPLETVLDAGSEESSEQVPEDDVSSGNNARQKRQSQSTSTAAGRAALNLRADAGDDITAESVFLRLEDVSVSYRGEVVVKKAELDIRMGDRIAIVGKNGSGKTSLLRILAGLQEPTKGEVVRSPAGLRVGYLRQEFHDDLNPTRTLREELSSALTEANAALARYHELENQVASVAHDPDRLGALLEELERARIECERVGAFNIDMKVDRVMAALGFVSRDDPEKLVASYSGGWKMRIGLGKVLLHEPHVLLLDEPSNHLDVDSVEWLENYLCSLPIPLVIVSHDREFIDRVCNKVVEMERGETVKYVGNYTSFLKQKKERIAAWQAAYERQMKYIEEQKAFINRFKNNAARASQVKSREKALEKFMAAEKFVSPPPGNEKMLRFRFPSAPRSARDLVSLRSVTMRYGDRTLFRNVDFTIERGDRIAVVGPNGSGKSTLLRLICGIEAPTEGEVAIAEYGTKIAYFEQNQADALDMNLTILETMQRAAPANMPYEQIRALLGRFLFKGDAVEKKVGSLSGGEKARLALCKILLEPANLLVLDEPGNHVDIEGRECLEEALQEYDGTLVIVSHDRYLVSQVATSVIAIENGKLEFYDGDYRFYCEQHLELRQRLRERTIAGVTDIKSAPVEAMARAGDGQLHEERKKTFGGSGVKNKKDNMMNSKRWND
jgi:ATP-binding cassette subfamily F protein 3